MEYSVNVVRRVLLCLIIIGCIEICSTDLIQVQMIVRHGARTPMHGSYPTDPYKDAKFDPIGRGQLTSLGKEQAFKLGTILRSRYDSLLGPTYFPSKQKLVASNMPRTQMTALALMAGLWPPTQHEQLSTDLMWQPIPYSTKEVLPGPSIIAKVMTICKDPEFMRKLETKYNETLQYIQKNAGTPGVCESASIYPTLNAQDVLKLKLPDWTASIYPQPLEEIAGVVMQELGGEKEIRKKNCDILLEVTKSFDATIAGNSTEAQPLLSILVAHDLTVAQMQICLNVFKPHAPGYVSNLAFELHQHDNGSFAVKMLYQPYLDQGVRILILPGCEEKCPYKYFKKAVMANF